MDKHYFDAAKASKFDNEGRLGELRPHELLKDRGGISDGMVCVDLGSGTGTFAIPMSDCVGNNGTVYAIDNSQAMINHIHTRSSAANLTPVHAEADKTGLKSHIADLCLMAFILHEVDSPATIIAEAARLLKPGGRALVVEWRAELDTKGPPKSVRLDKARIESLFEQAKFNPVVYVNWSINHCVATATK